MTNTSKILRAGLVLTFLVIGIALLIAARPTAAERGADIRSISNSLNSWWDNDWDYRVLVTVSAGGFARENKPAEASLNFTTLFASVGASGTFDPNSLRVIEVDGGNNVLDAVVPFQFDPAGDYDAATKAAGTLTWLMEGNTGSGATRRYHVYFDVTGKGFSAPSFTSLVTTTDNINWNGYQSIRLVTQNGTYYYHKPGGGFASLFDAGNNDWISWNSSTTPSGAAGDFRGIPNMVFPSDGGYFHPGRSTAATTLVSQGPLKATFRSTSDNNEWTTVWEVFPTYARMTVTKAPATNYWFLYEGTPGGLLETGTDTLTRSDGSTIPASGTWTTDIPDEEWLYVSDPNVGRSLYLVHHQDDNKVDAYYAMDDLMTVFGFGRKSVNRYLTGTDRQFTFGLVNSTDFDSVEGVVYNAWKSLNVTVGNAEARESQTTTVTATVSQTSTATATATASQTPTATTTATPPTPGTPTASPTATVPPTATPTGTGEPPAFKLLLPVIIE
jgi:hypothetical protein